MNLCLWVTFGILNFDSNFALQVVHGNKIIEQNTTSSTQGGGGSFEDTTIEEVNPCVAWKRESTVCLCVCLPG